MYFERDSVFKRQYKKLPNEVKEKVGQRLTLLAQDTRNPLLNDHKLSSPYEGYRSINITGDCRLVYRKINTDTYYLRAVGTHHQLYGS